MSIAQLSPNEVFPLVRQIANHLDTNTYFVRGIIREATTDKIIATVDLDDKGGQYFRSNWKVIYDNSAMRGRYISITTSVYTDSGHTTKSENYGDEVQTYVVQERWDTSKFTVGGGGDTFGDHKKIREIIREEIDKTGKPKELDLKSLRKEIVKDVIKQLPKNTPVDLSFIESLVNSLNQELHLRPKFEKTDLIPLEKSLNNISKIIEKDIDFSELTDKLKEIEELQDRLPDTVKDIITPILTELLKRIDDLVKNQIKNFLSEEENEEKMKRKKKLNKLVIKHKINL